MSPNPSLRTSQLSRRGVVVAVFGCLVLSAVAGSSSAAAENLSESSTSAADRAAAIRAIPFDRMTEETRAKLLPIINAPDLYRRLPVVSIESDPDLYLHLVRHPEVVVNIWHQMGITQVTTQRVSDYVLDAADGAGTVSRIELVYGTPNLHVLYAEGLYEGGLIKNRITGKAVMVLQSDYFAGSAGETLVRNRLDVFIALDQRGVGVVAKTLQGLVGKSADHNFVETARFVGRLSKSAEENGPGIQDMAADLDQVAPEVRREFSDLAMLTHLRARHRLERGILTEAVAQPSVPLRSSPSTASRAAGVMQQP